MNPIDRVQAGIDHRSGNDRVIADGRGDVDARKVLARVEIKAGRGILIISVAVIVRRGIIFAQSNNIGAGKKIGETVRTVAGVAVGARRA